ncbi:MAG: ABC transporter permease subunit [Caldilineaceae bacterium]
MSQTTLGSVRVAQREERPAWHLTLRSLLGRDWAAAYVFVLPTILLMGGLIAYPFLKAVYISFTNTTTLQTGEFVGLQNYTNLLDDPDFKSAVWNTVVYTFWSIFWKFWLGLTAALLIHRLKRFNGLITGAILLPWIVPSVVTAIAWKGLLDPTYGSVNQALALLGFNTQNFPWFGGLTTALPSVIMVNVWSGIPFFTINLLAGLKAIDKEYYEAARIDGANTWRTFLHITLPGLRYVLIVTILLSTIWTFNGFDTIFLLTGGGPVNKTRVFSILAFDAFGSFRLGSAVAIAFIMAPVLCIFIVILGRYMMAGNRAEERPTAESQGGFARGLRVLAWPVRLLVKFVLTILGVINDTVESGIQAIGKALNRSLVGEAPERQRRARRLSRTIGAVVSGVILTLLILFELTPFYWVFTTAFKSTAQIVAFHKVFWPEPWTMEQFDTLLGPTRKFAVWYTNTGLVAIVSTAISVFVAALGGYGLTRLRWRGSNILASSVLIAYLMPAVMMFIPLYQLFNTLHLTNSLMGLMIAYPSFGLPFATWLMMGYYASIPKEMEEAAMIDGCNHFQAFMRVVLPLVSPALMAASMFAITLAWKEFIFAYVFLSKERLYTLSVGMAQMIVGDVQPWGELAAAALLMAIPVAILYIIGQRFMVAGLTAGAVKG